MPKSSGPAENLDDAADGPVAVVAEVENLGGDDHAFQILDRRRPDCARAYAMRGSGFGGELHAFGNLDPLTDAVVVRDHELPFAADAKFADDRGMGAAQHLDRISPWARPSGSIRENAHGDAVAMHGSMRASSLGM